MQAPIQLSFLEALGISSKDANRVITLQSNHSPAKAWQMISKTILASRYPFETHLALFKAIYPHWQAQPENAPAWVVDDKQCQLANLSRLLSELDFQDLKSFHQWSVKHYQEFWPLMTKKLNIQFKTLSDSLCDISQGVSTPRWFPGAKMNIVDSCFNAPSTATAIIYEDAHKTIHKLTYGELDTLSSQIAHNLLNIGFQPGDYIGIAMPMTAYAVAIYLGIIKIGGIVVSIADSFSSEEIAVRLQITRAKAVFTQDILLRSDKRYPLYTKVARAGAAQIFVVPYTQSPQHPYGQAELTDVTLRDGDIAWKEFLILRSADIRTQACDPMSACNILFSSGTTGQPKAIPWNHTTPIKAASDAYLHQNILPGDVLTWPTNLGWMMGPWLIYAALINQASIALYTDVPKDRAFGEFVARAKVTMLGVVPTMVSSWRQSQCMEGLDWSSIKIFSSTGECSNPEDMLFLMSLANYQPIIEYCGGTEIGGAYVSSTVIENNYPSLFTTPTMGLDFMILDEFGQPSDCGEVAIIPPSIGLSTELLQGDHDATYYKNMPATADGRPLRRHGDQIRRLENGYFRIEGRIDDTMNLGGIKVSSAEIERVLTGFESISEVAAIATSPPDNGPSLLVIYAATSEHPDKQLTIREMQLKINQHLNPLFKIHDLVFIHELPKTASNKIMRRMLRKEYMESR
jgi:acetyl-CoA synthetase